MVEQAGHAISDSKYLIGCGWDHAPHLTEEMKVKMMREVEPHLREARSSGEPGLSAGAVYPIPLEDITVAPFAIPKFWPKAYALDPGWNKTAALWLANDRDTGTVYLYAEHYRGQAEPSIHATAIKARGDWIPGVIDPSSRGRAQADGKQIYADYVAAGLNLQLANNAVEAGIQAVWDRLSTGTLKIFNTLPNFQIEYRMYQREVTTDPSGAQYGKIKKEHDHLMDCMRYLIAPATSSKDRTSGLAIAIVKPVKNFGVGSAVMGDKVVGY